MNATIVVGSIGLGTYAMRVSMFLVLETRSPPPWLEAAMDFVAPAAIAALLGTMLLTVDGRTSIESVPTLLASVAAYAAVRRSGNMLHAFAVGWPAFWLLTVVAS